MYFATEKDIYTFIINKYGMRGAWISNIAHDFSISYKQANILTLAMGYSRGKRKNILTTFVDFIADDRVKTICTNIINANQNKAS